MTNIRYSLISRYSVLHIREIQIFTNCVAQFFEFCLRRMGLLTTSPCSFVSFVFLSLADWTTAPWIIPAPEPVCPIFFLLHLYPCYLHSKGAGFLFYYKASHILLCHFAVSWFLEDSHGLQTEKKTTLEQQQTLSNRNKRNMDPWSLCISSLCPYSLKFPSVHNECRLWFGCWKIWYYPLCWMLYPALSPPPLRIFKTCPPSEQSVSNVNKLTWN